MPYSYVCMYKSISDKFYGSLTSENREIFISEFGRKRLLTL